MPNNNDNNQDNRVYRDALERYIYDPNYKKITYDENGNKIYPPQPCKYAPGSLEGLWFLVPLTIFLFAIGGAGGGAMGLFFTAIHLQDKREETTRRWKMECDHEEFMSHAQEVNYQRFVERHKKDMNDE